MRNPLRNKDGTFQKTWESDEVDNLVEKYPATPMQELLKLFPGKTKKAITRIVERNGVKRVDRSMFIPRGKDSPQWRGGKIKHICENCGKNFESFPSKGVGRYCSYKCARVDMRLEKHPHWSGGTSFDPYPTTFNDEFKSKIRARDNYTCAVCGGRGTDVHHIDYCKAHTTPDNCVTLCHSCHSKTNSNRVYWQSYFS